jgi:hypothetical protein
MHIGPRNSDPITRVHRRHPADRLRPAPATASPEPSSTVQNNPHGVRVGTRAKPGGTGVGRPTLVSDPETPSKDARVGVAAPRRALRQAVGTNDAGGSTRRPGAAARRSRGRRGPQRGRGHQRVGRGQRRIVMRRRRNGHHEGTATKTTAPRTGTVVRVGVAHRAYPAAASIFRRNGARHATRHRPLLPTPSSATTK